MNKILLLTAKLAKEKGFNKETNYFYYKNDGLDNGDGDNDFICLNHNQYENYFSAPTQSELQAWLRNEWDIQVNVIREYDYWTPVLVFISRENLEEELPAISKSYETALEVGLEYALKKLNSVNVTDGINIK